jgi:Arc/MetJ family transcription regulator
MDGQGYSFPSPRTAGERSDGSKRRAATSANLDVDLVAQAQAVLGTSDATETIHRALEDAIRRELLRRLAQRAFEDLTPHLLVELRRPRTNWGV